MCLKDTKTLSPNVKHIPVNIGPILGPYRGVVVVVVVILLGDMNQVMECDKFGLQHFAIVKEDLLGSGGISMFISRVFANFNDS